MRYLVSFPASAMVVTPEEMAEAVVDSHAVVRDMQDAGVLVWCGGLDPSVPPVVVAADGAVSDEPYATTAGLDGGLTVIDVPTRAEAVAWAARLAAACRCPQELREIPDDADA